MKKTSRNLLLSLFLSFLVLIPFKAQALESSYTKDLPCNKSACNLRMAERRL